MVQCFGVEMFPLCRVLSLNVLSGIAKPSPQNKIVSEQREGGEQTVINLVMGCTARRDVHMYVSVPDDIISYQSYVYMYNNNTALYATGRIDVNIKSKSINL